MVRAIEKEVSGLQDNFIGGDQRKRNNQQGTNRESQISSSITLGIKNQWSK